MRLVWGTVATVEDTLEGLQRITVRLPDAAAPERAVVFTALCEPVSVGSSVLVNTTAVDLGLGTGGAHIVVARGGEGVSFDRRAERDGHIMKLRYTPLQFDVLAVEAPESPHHATMSTVRDVGGMPVVCCSLHSQVPLVAAAVKAVVPEARVAYCMTDHAALPLALSDVMMRSLRKGLVDVTITCGQSFGGTLEAVTLHSGLLAAKHVAFADVAIVAIGPGVVGTSTPFGHGGIALGEALNAVSAVGGTPIAALRVSFADERPRHQGISHHSITALGSIALTRSVVPTVAMGEAIDGTVSNALAESGIAEKHSVFSLPSLPDIDMRGIRVTTMGRAENQDPAFFAFSYAAGAVAGLHLL